MPNPSAKVIVHPTMGDFTIVFQSPTGGGTATIADRDHVIEQTIKSLELARATGATVELDAPDWLRTELESRGYRF